MNAWLLTWEWSSAKPVEKIVAVLSSRRSDSSIAELMELLVLRSIYPAREVAYYANRKKAMVYKAQTPLNINGVPHGERILCGHDPWLYGRKVRDLKITVDESTDEEVITWREPKNFKWTDDSRNSITVDTEGELKEWRRPNKPLSRDIWVWEA
jgi:hypothetical protein